MTPSIRYAGLTDVGRVREKNEDRWRADPELGLFIVADGMGGHAAGDLAARIVVETLPDLVRRYFGTDEPLPESGAKQRITGAIAELSRKMQEQTQNEPGLAGMGSTVVCALVRGGRMLLSYLGDSRAYRLRAGRLRQLTTDHTLVRLLIDSGDLTPEQAATHPSRGQLTRCVGMPGEPLPEARLLRLDAGDLVLLCTDGLTGMVTDREISKILTGTASLESKCDRLIRSANEAGGHDNVTAVLLSVVDDEQVGTHDR